MINCHIDPEYYRATNEDLQEFTDQELFEHFNSFGKHEGRVGSPFALRESFTALIQGRRQILEIGPFLNPIMSGPCVRYFDVLDADGLKRRAAEIGYPGKPIEQIHFVSPTGDLSIVDLNFDAVVSSHSIEHQPDLIEHFIQVNRLLNDDGKYFIIIPDKRFCFDHFLGVSTIADTVQAHAEKRVIHSLASVIEHRALTTHNDTVRHWLGDHADPHYQSSIGHRTRTAVEEFALADGRYIDVHAWQFTPDSFYDLVMSLNEAGFSPLRIDRIYQTPIYRNEFIAILSRP